MKSKFLSCMDVSLSDGFWLDRYDLNRDVTCDAVYQRFCEMGKVQSFRCAWKPGDPESRKPHYFWDSDVAKWIEGASYILMHGNDEKLVERIEGIIDGIENNMTPDGYFNVYYIPFGLSGRFTERPNHELYCAGHHFEAACAYYKATGKDRYLKLMDRYGHLIYKIFVEEKSAKFVTPGHPEIELALITMYRTTGDKMYLDLCSFFVEQRGNNDKDVPMFNDPLYAMDNLPLRKAEKAEGHSVRTNYLMSGVCDLAYETDDNELYEACERVFGNIAEKRMYITGGQGSTYLGERYTVDYDLPNRQAYAETCASISLAMFAKRMTAYKLSSKFDDVCERVLFNGIISGVSKEGDSFFYENPLEFRNSDYALDYHSFYERHHEAPRTRKKMFNCSCCPPNILRLTASVADYIYSYNEEKDMLIVHQFISSKYDKDGKSISLSTNFPADGKIKISVGGVKKLAVRIPYYSKDFAANAEYKKCDCGYAIFDVSGKTEVEIDLGLCTRYVYANTNVYDNIGKAAVMYGPVVYCAETADNENVESFFADTKIAPATAESKDYSGLPTVTLSGFSAVSDENLYSDKAPEKKPCKLNLVPFYSFCNRGEGEMVTYFHIAM